MNSASGAARARSLALVLLIVVTGAWARAAGAEPARNTDRLVWYVHTNVAAQLDEARLRSVLADATRALEGRSDPLADYACCSAFEHIELRSFGSADDGLDLIDSQADYDALPADIKLFVADITWCGGPSPSAIGCADLFAGGQLVVALDARGEVVGKVVAHERGHNAGLDHRSDQECNLMHPAVGEQNVCVDAAECAAWRALGTQSGSCSCHLDDPPGTPLADDTPCTEPGFFGTCIDGGVCTLLPDNDLCVEAAPLGDGDSSGSSRGAFQDGPDACSTGEFPPTGADVWYDYTPTCSGTLFADLCGATFDTVLSVHEDCPATEGNELICNDDCLDIPGCGLDGGFESCLSAPVTAGVPVRLRVTGFEGVTGDFPLHIRCAGEVPDRDEDGVADAADNCPDASNPAQADADEDGIGDACECGDASGDGSVNSIDARLIQRCAVGVFACPELCDVTGEGACNSIDARLVQRLAVGVLQKGDLHCAQRP